MRTRPALFLRRADPTRLVAGVLGCLLALSSGQAAWAQAPPDLSPVGLDLVRPHVQAGRWIWLGDSYSVSSRSRVPYATLAAWPLDRIEAVAPNPRVGFAKLFADGSPAYRNVTSASAYGLIPTGPDTFAEHLGLPLYLLTEWPSLAGSRTHVLGVLRLSDDLEDGAHGSMEEVSLRPVFYLPKVVTDAYTGTVRLDTLVIPLPTQVREQFWSPAASLPWPALSGDVYLRAEPGAGSLLYATTLVTSAGGSGHYAQFLADASWDYAGFGLDTDPTPQRPKAFRASDFASYLAATTVRADQQPIVAYYLVNERFPNREESTAAVENVVAVARAAAAQAGLPAPVILLVHAQAVLSGSVTTPAENEAAGLVLREVALRHDDVAFVSIYAMTDGMVFNGTEAARTWLTERGCDAFRYGRHTEGDLGPVDLAGPAPGLAGNLLPDGLHPAGPDAAAFFAAVIGEALRPGRVGSTNPYNVVPYSCSTEPEASFPVVQPAPGTVLRRGQRTRVTWTSPDPAPATARVLIGRDGGPYTQLWTGPNTGTVVVTLPASATPATDYRIRVEDAANADQFGLSGAFTLIDPAQVFRFQRPIAFQQWALGATRDVRWTSPAGAPAGDVVLELTRRTTGEVVYSTTTANDGIEPFVVDPAYGAGQYIWKIRAAANGAYAGQSGVTLLSEAEVTSPLGPNLTWAEGQNRTVLWDAPTVTDPAAFVRVFLRRADGPTLTLTTSTGNDGSFTFTVPTLPTASDYYLQVTLFADGGPYVATSRPFTITGTGEARSPHFALAPAAVGLPAGGAVAVGGLGEAEEVAVRVEGRVLGAAAVVSGRAVVDITAGWRDDALGTSDEAALVALPHGTLLTLVAWSSAGGERDVELVTPLHYAVGREVAGAGRTGHRLARGRVDIRPNPAYASAVVRVAGLPDGAATLTVTDVLGRRVHSATLAADATEVRLSTIHLPAGVYTVRVTRGGATAEGRFTVIR